MKSDLCLVVVHSEAPRDTPIDVATVAGSIEGPAAKSEDLIALCSASTVFKAQLCVVMAGSLTIIVASRIMIH
jgi:hypothetical protein